jgi:hypothetical protein
MLPRVVCGLLVLTVSHMAPSVFACSLQAGQAANRPPRTESPVREIRLGKFEILASYTYARALGEGRTDHEAKERGIVAAVMGARSRGVARGGRTRPDGSTTTKQSPGTRKKTLTAETYDEQVSSKLQPFYDGVFLPTMKKLVEAHLSYEQVKKLLEIPPAVGAKITADEFTQRTSVYLKRAGKP